VRYPSSKAAKAVNLWIPIKKLNQQFQGTLTPALARREREQECGHA